MQKMTMLNPSLPYNLTAEASYPTPYATSQFLSLILLSMVGQKHTPKTTTDIKDSYDYVIGNAKIEAKRPLHRNGENLLKKSGIDRVQTLHNIGGYICLQNAFRMS
ncbi:hypothetical protein NPIL_339341 [Nephila pilipes]|uniref:Uncharacterized protein n=1 Tax=Nephila pilipes TaxID=299642 RepID=A0A8X6PMA1_NEPPI|nr:hypothetical protein NPIL_339341 [Nephila pilipes]